MCVARGNNFLKQKVQPRVRIISSISNILILPRDISFVLEFVDSSKYYLGLTFFKFRCFLRYWNGCFQKRRQSKCSL